MRHRYVLSMVGAFMLTLLPSFVSAETIDQNRSTATNLGLYGGEVRDVAIDPDSDYVYVTTYSPNGFFVSADDGATWRGLNSEEYDLGEPRGVELDEDGNVYLLIGGALYKSLNQGTTLTEIGDLGGFGDNLLYHNGTLMIGRTDGAVSFSTDQGATFITSDPIQGNNSYVLSLAASPTAGTYYATLDDMNNATLYKSVDGGLTWSEANTDDVANRFTTIFVNPLNANFLLLSSYGENVSPWGSLDGGATWSQISAITVPGTAVVDSTGRMYIGANYTDNGGNTWSQLNVSTPANRVSNIWIDPSDDNHIFGSTFGAVAISEDRGTTWIDSNEGITAVTVLDVAQSTDKNTVWIATNAGLAHTADFLAETPTWEFPINYDYYPSAVWVSPTDSNVVVVGGYIALYRTTDGGDTWTTIPGWNSDYAAKRIVSDPNDPTTVYIAVATQNMTDALTGDVLKSTDNGATWTSMNIADDAASQALAVAANGDVYVGAGTLGIRGTVATGVYKYDGANWNHLEGSPDEQITSLVADRDDANVLYATASDFNSYRHTDGGVYKTTDGGVTWTNLAETGEGLENAAQYRVITIQNSTNTLYMAGTNTENNAGTIWKSTDGGTTWGIYYTGLQNEKINTLLFDGLIAGNSRGAYDIRGKVKFTLKKGSTEITATLKDAATDRKLKHKKVTLWKKTRGHWVKIDSDRTNNQAFASFNIHPKKTTRYQVRYNPTGAAAEEYTLTRSKILTVKI